MGFFDFFKKRGKDPTKQLKELLDGYELPSFPASVMKVLEMLRDPEASLSDISKLIEADPGMHVAVLKTVNSAAYGFPRKISNIQHAINLLGKNRLESIILPIAVNNNIPLIELYCLSQRDFWKTCAKRACLARAIATRLHPVTQAESFTAGLLQDMAIPVLIKVKEKKYCLTLEMWNTYQESHLDRIEREKFGFDHQAIGALMAQRWEFPEYLLNAILFHHSAPNGNIPKAVTAVSHIRYSLEKKENKEDDYVIDILKNTLSVKKEIAIKILDQAHEEANEFAAIFS